MQNKQRSIVGLFTKFDEGVMERLCGSLHYKRLLVSEQRDAFTF